MTAQAQSSTRGLRDGLVLALRAHAANVARAGQHRQAEQLLDTLVQVAPDADLYCLLGKVRAQRGSHAAALDALQQALRLEPGHGEAAAALGRVSTLTAPVPAARVRVWRGIALMFGIVALLAVATLALRVGASRTAVDALRAEISRELTSQRELLERIAGPLAPADTSAARIGQAVFTAYRRAAARLLPYESFGTVTFTGEFAAGRLLMRGEGTVPTRHVLAELSALAGSGAGAGFTLDLESVGVSNNYVVRHGDSLESIAQALYGSTRAWPELWRDNASRVSDPHVITPGTVLMTR